MWPPVSPEISGDFLCWSNYRRESNCSNQHYQGPREPLRVRSSKFEFSIGSHGAASLFKSFRGAIYAPVCKRQLCSIDDGLRIVQVECGGASETRQTAASGPGARILGQWQGFEAWVGIYPGEGACWGELDGRNAVF